jgi:hypothetical protein
MNTDDLARLMIYLAALIVWALSDKDKELYRTVLDQGIMRWDALKEEAYEKS